MSLLYFDKNFIYNDRFSNLHSLFYACRDNNIELVKWIFHFDYSLNYDYIINSCFLISCYNGDLNLAKWLFEKNKLINIEDNFEDIFYVSLEDHQNYNLVKWLHNNFPQYRYLIDYDKSFNICCEYENYELAELISIIYPDLHISKNNDYLFRNACVNNNFKLAQLLTKIRPNGYYLSVLDNEIIHYEIINTLIIKNIIKKEELKTLDFCLICYDKFPEILTKCNHFYCFNCIEKHNQINDEKCPYCRISNKDYELKRIV